MWPEYLEQTAGLTLGMRRPCAVGQCENKCPFVTRQSKSFVEFYQAVIRKNNALHCQTPLYT